MSARMRPAVWSNTSGNTVNTSTGVASAPIFGSGPEWNGGIQLGYDYMMPSRVVLGVEADVSSGGKKTTTITDASGTSADQTTVFDSETVRGRLGYAFNNILLYGTAGWAWSNDQFIRTQLAGTLNLATAGTDEAVNAYLGGWTWGGGIAFAFAQNWNAFAEYRTTNFGSSTISLPFSQLSATSTTEVKTLEVGLNYKFNWGAPAEPDYVMAADLKDLKVAPIFTPPSASYPYNWSGLYVGGDGGYGWVPANGTLSDAVGGILAPYSYSVTGPFAGSFVGANYQFDQIVAGIEGDWQKSNLIGNNQQQAPIGAAVALPAPTGVFPGGPFTVSTTIKNYGSVRGRIRDSIRSLPGLRYRRLGLGRPFGQLRPPRRRPVCQQRRPFLRLDGRRGARLRFHRSRVWPVRISVHRHQHCKLRESRGQCGRHGE